VTMRDVRLKLSMEELELGRLGTGKYGDEANGVTFTPNKEDRTSKATVRFEFAG